MRSTLRRGLGILVLSLAMMLTLGGGVALAQADDTYPTVPTIPTSVGGTSVTNDPGGGRSSSSLPFTGGDVALLTLFGVAAVGSGAAIVLLNRRSRSTSASI